MFRFSFSACLFIGLILGHSPTAVAEDLIESAFDFGEGRPYRGQTTIGGVTILLETTNTEPFGRVFRDVPNRQPADVFLCFSQPVSRFQVSFKRMLEGESIKDFNLGAPDAVSGDLIDTGDHIYSVPASVGDVGEGTLEWTDLEAPFVYFRIDKPFGALAVDRFAFVTASEQPLGPEEAGAVKNPCTDLAKIMNAEPK